MVVLGTLALDAAIDIDRVGRGAWASDVGPAFPGDLAKALRDLDVDGDPSDTHALHGLVAGLGHEVATVDDLRGVLSGYADELEAFGPGVGDSRRLVDFCLAFHRMALAEWDRRYGDQGWLGLVAA